MTDFSYFIGIDVSKEKVDIFFTKNGRYYSVSNDELSVEKALKKYTCN
ncbi:MAG: hypothetical protein LBC04_02185 [Holosporaceae bacterium]|jgi:hypothetical protein|nr:hypothetical protein [Holosporaceae bacterium]